MSASPAGPLAPDVARARHHLIGLYFLTGFAVATWLARLPSIRTALDLSAAELGTVLVVGSVGSLAMVVVAGGLTNRWGSGRTLLTAAVMFSVANVLVGIGPAVGSVGLLAVGILISSSSYALSNVPMNLETVVIERAMGRPVVPQFHAAFSIGSVTGSLIGAGVSWMGVPVVWHFVALSAVALLVRALAIPGAVLPLPGLPPGVVHPTAGRRGSGMRAALAAWREPRTLVIGLIVMVGALSEGSANNWMTIAVVDGFVQTEAVAAVVFGVFVGSMTVARLLGTSVIERFGRSRVLVGSAVSSAVGLMLFGLAPSLLLAAVGAVGWGLGAGLVVPIGMASVSGDRLRTAGRVSVISAFGSLASIVAPPLLGIAAEVIGIRHALLFIGGGFLLSIALARTVESEDAAPLRARPEPARRRDAVLRAGSAQRRDPAQLPAAVGRPDAELLPNRAPRQGRRATEPAAPEPAVAGTC